ncbi:MAG: DNA polymerase III subunit beta [Thermacetogeniaceae bacterium]
MKVRCSKSVLNNALSSLSRITPTRPVQPILGGFMIFTRDDTLVLQATDLELSLTIVIPAQVENEGCIVVTGRYLMEIVRRLPDGDLTLQFDDINQQVEILYGNASAHINTLAPSDFPSLPATPSQNRIIMDGNRWKNSLIKITFAASPQEIRPNYAGVYMEFKSGYLKMVSTDTYRLALLTMPYECNNSEITLFVPVRPLGEVIRLLEDEQQLEIIWDQTIISFQTKKFTLTARLMDAQFPAYERVIPKECRLRIKINKALLNDTLERAALFNELPSQQSVVDLKVDAGTLFISAQSSQMGSLNEEIVLGCAEGEETQAAFTTRYLLDPLKVMEQEDVVLCLNGPREPAIYLEEGEESYLHLVLPVRRLLDNTGEAEV